MSSPKHDAISIVEAAYDLEGDTRSWLGRLLDNAGPQLDLGLGVTVSMAGPGIRADDSLAGTYNLLPERAAAAMAMIADSPHIFDRVVLGPGSPCSTPSEAMGMTVEEARNWDPYVKFMHPVGVRDFLGVLARDPSGHVVFLTAPSPDVRRPTLRQRRIWGRVATHIGAGLRLRRALADSQAEPLCGASAVLSPSGNVVHAEEDAKPPALRDALRIAARSIDAARSKSRLDDDEALSLWQGLIAGRWSLVDHFDSDGRRFLVARRNDPEVEDPRALSLRERQVLAYVAMGHPLKLIAYALGLSESVVARNRTDAMRKLGLRTRAEVVTLFSPSGRPDSGDDATSASTVAATEYRNKVGS